MKKLNLKLEYLLFLVLFLAFPGFSRAQTPTVANYYLKWTIEDYEARELAKWDLLILDMEVQSNSRKQLEKIRELNPEIIILAYITSQETNANIYQSQWSRQASLRKKLVDGIENSWWLRDNKGNRISFWSGTYMLNLSDQCPRNSAGQNWSTYLADFMKREILSTGLWDGIFYDNIWPDLAWIGSDINLGTGRMSIADLNKSWVNGTKNLLQYTRSISPQAFLVGNGGISLSYQKDLNGMMFENFVSPWESGGTWSGTMNTYSSLQSYNRQPQLVVINSYDKNRNNFSKVRFGLASTLLADQGYFSFDYDNTNHGQLWWYDEYDVEIGQATLPAVNLLNKENSKFSSGLWRRDYSQAIVLLNSSNKNQSYAFRNEEFEKIKGTQDPRVNDGSIVNYVNVDAGDALLLLKRSSGALANNFINGYFSRVFNPYGDQTRNGFFSSSDSFSGGVKLIKKGETNVAGLAGKFSAFGFYNISINPYGPNYKGLIDVAFLSDTEVVTGATVGGPHVRVYNLSSGRLVSSFFAFDKNLRNGVNVSAGDLNGDGQPEIVATQNTGGLPEVRIFNSSGKLLGKFMAYDQRFRGGVSVAVADVNGDGFDEIITGPGKTGGPDIRVFDRQGKLISRFWAYETSYSGGVKVLAEDLNDDGVAEILASIPNF